MTWFKVDDTLAFHRKVVSAGNAAMGLWVRAGSWCALHLTDGHVPEHMVLMLGTTAQARRLVKAGLWIEVSGGYLFHEWNEEGRQPTAKKVRDLRKSSADRQSRWRDRKLAKPQVGDSSHAVTNGVSHAVSNGVRNASPDPTRPDPTRSTTTGHLESPGTSSEPDTNLPPRKRGSRIPDDFAVSAEMVEWARRNTPHVDGRYETEQFRDYWLSKAGRDAAKIDWVRTWQSWMRKAEQQAPRAPHRLSAVPQRVPTTTARVAAIEALRDDPGAAS